MPHIVVVINNISVLFETFPALENELFMLFRESSRYGIHFVVACNAFGDLRTKMLGSFKNVLEPAISKKNDSGDLHIICSIPSSKLSSIESFSWGNAVLGVSQYVWIGDKINNQYNLPLNHSADLKVFKAGDGGGFLVKRSQPEMIKFFQEV